MVIRGKMRGNGSQLADYLWRKADNDNIWLFEIRGTSQPNDLKKSLQEMSFTSELTKSHKGLYHAQINPAYGEDRQMKREDWIKAADILEAQTAFEGQKRVIVLHEKEGRIHAHVVWERYDHEKGKMKSDSFLRLAQDRARQTIEKELDHQRTPIRNARKSEIKTELTNLWRSTATAKEFIQAAKEKGYAICSGSERPYMVVDDTARSFDLVRQLEGIRTKEVRERFRNSQMPTDKQAMKEIRQSISTKSMNGMHERFIDSKMKHQQDYDLCEEPEMKKKRQLKEKETSSANDNGKQHFSMGGSFKISSEAQQKDKEKIDLIDAKRRERETNLAELKKQFEEKAKSYVNNARDMFR